MRDVPLIDVEGSRDLDEAEPPTGGRIAVLGVLAAIVGLIIGVWLLGSSGGDDSSSDADSSPDTESATPEDEGSISSSPSPPPEIIASPVLEALGTDVSLALFTDEVVTTIDLGSGLVTTAGLSTDPVYELDRYALLSDGRRTVGVNRDDPTLAAAIGSVGTIVPAADPRTYAIVTTSLSDRDEGIIIGQTFEGLMRQLEAPAGSVQLGVPGLGVLVMPPTGGTYLAGLSGFTLFAEGRVLAATASARLEIRCDAALDCGAVIVDASSDRETDVDMAFVSTVGTFILSPDGRWIVRSGPDQTLLYDTSSGTSEMLPVTAPGAPRWSPDSSFLTWLDPEIDEPALEFAIVASGDAGIFRVGLSALGEDLLPVVDFAIFS